MRARLSALVLAAVVSIATGAAAQRTGPIIGAENKTPGVLGPAERFKASDVDGDGKVTKTEFAATLIADARPHLNAIWTNRDKNRDGWLSLEEMTSNGAVLRPGPAGTLGPNAGDGPARGADR
jgi:hypothetical protein